MPWGAAAICLVVCIDQNSIILCHHPINWCNLRENKLMIVRYTQNTQFYVCQYPFYIHNTHELTKTEVLNSGASIILNRKQIYVII